jgi:putative holliday junction resolvase
MIVGIDYGRKRIGLAVLQLDGLVLPLATIEQRSRKASLEAVAVRVAELRCRHVVLGWPLNMDGTAGPAAHAAERFATELRLLTGAEVELHDERLSSVEARARIQERPGRQKRGERDDALAACVILESWLRQHSR